MLIQMIDKAIEEADIFVLLYYSSGEKEIEDVKRILRLLKHEVAQNPNDINERVLKAMVGISAVSAKSYEPSEFGNVINKVTSTLYYELPNYKYLEPLWRTDFWKSDPI